MFLDSELIRITLSRAEAAQFVKQFDEYVARQYNSSRPRAYRTIPTPIVDMYVILKQETARKE